MLVVGAQRFMAICVAQANYLNTCRRKKLERMVKSSEARKNFSISASQINLDFPRPIHGQKNWPELSGELHQQIVYMSNRIDRDLHPLRSSSWKIAWPEMEHGLGEQSSEKSMWKKCNYPRQEFSNTQQQKMQNQEDFGLAVKPRKSWQDTQSNCFVNENRKRRRGAHRIPAA